MADDRDLLLEEEDLPSPAPTPAPTSARNPQHADPVHDAKREELAKRERQIQDLLSTIAAERNRDVKSLSNILDSNYKTSQQKQDQLLAAIETLRKRDILWVRVGKGLGVVLALLFVLQAVVWLAAPKVAPATDKSIYDGLRIDTTSRPGEVWVYSENNSWIKDMEQKVDDEKLRNGWCKALIKK
ncbi:MAG TPA: hypothetical protein PKH10_02515 [bacterium]|nr:hypothetical protein [bacterium]